ncbi:hypothetical protein JL722_7302 [Aureococcus anophagefferens]|nr:hypothetical protein JL722_7302 [Aureococcus anophagefferens]
MAPSWQWIAVVLLNTMNGPGFVTLPQAGRDAGPGVVVAVIGGFGLLAAFTSRRAIAVVAELEARRGAGGVGDFASMSRGVLGARGGRGGGGVRRRAAGLRPGADHPLAAIETYRAARALDVFARGSGPSRPVWLLACASKDSGAFGLVVDWTSVLLLGLTNFSLPLALDEALGYPKLKRSSSSDLLLLGAAAAPRSRSRAASRVAFVAATAAFVALIAARCGAPEVVAAAARWPSPAGSSRGPGASRRTRRRPPQTPASSKARRRARA